ncbi:hypothetical protein XBFFL1_910048 [Xenorhabdus bovienii str. feltiae Florida]|uniref:Uncharacterized protein n=3 Tax=Xenorhabdus bovienii TaxID=40576 RepID=A0A0B6XDC1_XENBV|nr:hypothetical protein XBFFL1_910048 [Xenorhabdus bovienii str. feltiae Florida]CDH03572.1 hypothetical protein XBFM1_810086 [Xenorhabdus bovienii str. feltiae Moldova]CDH22516.1 hypothetical protein XBKB1_1200018 [Xenorhabdus bovienii str. kraussei Becker Underwood]CDM91580.1 protein of unknown function [Xenorhabdus bovienii]
MFNVQSLLNKKAMNLPIRQAPNNPLCINYTADYFFITSLPATYCKHK